MICFWQLQTEVDNHCFHGKPAGEICSQTTRWLYHIISQNGTDDHDDDRGDDNDTS